MYYILTDMQITDCVVSNKCTFFFFIAMYYSMYTICFVKGGGGVIFIMYLSETHIYRIIMIYGGIVIKM